MQTKQIPLTTCDSSNAEGCSSKPPDFSFHVRFLLGIYNHSFCQSGLSRVIPEATNLITVRKPTGDLPMVNHNLQQLWQYSFIGKVIKKLRDRGKTIAAKHDQAGAFVSKSTHFSLLVKSFKRLKIWCETKEKKFFIIKHRDCDKTTAAKQNKSGTVVFKQHPLLTTN